MTRQDPVPQAHVGEYVLGNITFPIYRSLILTTQHALARTWLEHEKAYVELTGDKRFDLDDETVRMAVSGAVQEAWYRHFNKPMSESVQQNQQRRLKAAKEKHVSEQTEQAQTEGGTIDPTRPKKEKKSREPRTTVRGLIREGIKANLSDAEITAMINERLPGKIVRKKSIRWNRKDLNIADPTPATPAAA
jgi:hypothetical protein